MNREFSEHSWKVCVSMYVCMHVCASVRMCKYRYGMLQSTLIPPCQYLLSILRFEERELVSVFMDAVKHEILSLSKPCDSMHAHAHTGQTNRERKPCTAWIESSNKVY